MSLLERFDLTDPNPESLWDELDPDTRRLAADALYRGGAQHEAGRRQADAAIAARLRFRDVAVRRLPIERRVAYIVGPVRPDATLASALLLALHVERRRPLLEALLERLGIPHDGGVIRDDHELAAPDPARLAEAVQALYAAHDPDEVDLYLSSLVAMDREIWSGLAELLRRRAAGPPSPAAP